MRRETKAEDPRSAIDQAFASNGGYAAAFSAGAVQPRPRKGLAVVACMDARLDVHGLLGLQLGDAHVIRNAGGVVTQDVVRSLVVSQWRLGTREIALIHHTDCGQLGFRDADLKREIEQETGRRPRFALQAFADLDADVRRSLRRLHASPFVDATRARGFVYDVTTGRLREVR
jgi:carbonic anhydrase